MLNARRPKLHEIVLECFRIGAGLYGDAIAAAALHQISYIELENNILAYNSE